MKVFDPKGVDTIPQEDRILAAEAIGRAGDPRITEAGSDENWLPVIVDGREQPWCIAKYPVTVEEFSEFVEEGGYEEARWWKDLAKDDAWTQPAGFIEQLRTPNRPVVGVALAEALAYCRWATSLRNSFGRRGQVNLPTRGQWLHVATAGDVRPYPWGRAQPTARESWQQLILKDDAKMSPNPVGLLPDGAAMSGALDMFGTVSQWIATEDAGDWMYVYTRQRLGFVGLVASHFPGHRAKVHLRSKAPGGAPEYLKMHGAFFWVEQTYRDEDRGFRCVLADVR